MRLIVIPAFVMVCTCVSAQTSPPQPRTDTAAEIDSESSRAFAVTVRNLLNQEDFQQLESIAGNLRAEKARFPGGEWKILMFYATLQGPGSVTSTDAAWNAHIARLNKWIGEKPDSITPRIALAHGYLRYAWKARGNDESEKVTDEGWKLFGQRVQQARAALEHAPGLPAQDPEWYHAMLTVALGQGWPPAEAAQLVRKAISVEPAYYEFYRAYVNYLLPKWYGKPGEAETFLKTSTDLLGGAEGAFIYFKVASEFNCCKRNPQMPAVSWDRVKQGFNQAGPLYGRSSHERNTMAFMAVRQGDTELAQKLFTRIGDDWDQRVWGRKEKFDSARQSAAAPK